MIVVELLGMGLLACGLSGAAAHIPRVLPLPYYGRLAFGFAVTPSMMGGLYLLAIVFFTSPSPVLTSWLP
jgi:hypothetical protein